MGRQACPVKGGGKPHAVHDESFAFDKGKTPAMVGNVDVPRPLLVRRFQSTGSSGYSRFKYKWDSPYSISRPCASSVAAADESPTFAASP